MTHSKKVTETLALNNGTILCAYVRVQSTYTHTHTHVFINKL